LNQLTVHFTQGEMWECGVRKGKSLKLQNRDSVMKMA